MIIFQILCIGGIISLCWSLIKEIVIELNSVILIKINLCEPDIPIIHLPYILNSFLFLIIWCM